MNLTVFQKPLTRITKVDLDSAAKVHLNPESVIFESAGRM
jgi:hypothetical protein